MSKVWNSTPATWLLGKGEVWTKSAKTSITSYIRGAKKSHPQLYHKRRDIEQLTDDELINGEEFSLLREETKEFIRQKCSQVEVKGQLRKPHKYINEHKEETIYRKKRDKALKQTSFSSSYYSKVKNEYRENNPILPLNVFDGNINRVYRIMDAKEKLAFRFAVHRRFSGKLSISSVIFDQPLYA